MHARSKDKQDLVLQHYLDGHSKDFKSISFKHFMVLARQQSLAPSRDQLLLKIAPKKGKSVTVKYCHFSNNFLFDKKLTELVCIELNGNRILRFLAKDIESLAYQIIQPRFVDVFSSVFNQTID